MSVLIKGMEMPKHDDEYVIFTVYGDGGVVYGKLNRPHVRYKNRAVPVPEPHGRLIDADAVLKNIKPINPKDQWIGCTIETTKRLMMSLINRAPTVIPASEEGEAW